VQRQEIARVEQHLKDLFDFEAINIRGRSAKADSAEVHLGEEFIGVVFRGGSDIAEAYGDAPSAPFEPEEVARVERYLRFKFRTDALQAKQLESGASTAIVHRGATPLGTLGKEFEDNEVTYQFVVPLEVPDEQDKPVKYQFNMAILEMDLEEGAP
jgi:hypothetical protein